jgi:hypothetical protein
LVRITTWQILDGSGEYADLRGRGWVRAEPLEIRDSVVTFRSTLGGVADRDAIAPTIGISSARATKLRRPARAYSIRVALALRDDVEGNSVSYTLRVFSARGIELARKSGTAEVRHGRERSCCACAPRPPAEREGEEHPARAHRV